MSSKYFNEIKICFLPLLGMFFTCAGVKAQLLPKLNKTINEGANIIRGVGNLVNAAKRTTADFNKNVTVVKGNPATRGNAGTTNPPVAPVPVVGKATEPKFKNGKFTNFLWEPVSYFDGQLFPSSIICMSTYKGQLTPMLEAISRPLGFRLMSKSSNIPLHWEIECVEKKYFDKVSGTVVFQQADREVDLQPDLPWNFETLGNQFSSAPINVYFRIFDDDGNKEEKTIPIYVRSIDDCITQYKDQSLTFLFTGYIQEQHPEIDKILKEALNTKIIDAIDGYQGGEDYVDKQVEAIWRVLHNRGFQYSSITKTTGNNGNINSQEVRTFANSIKTSQANCVDGTVVFASILRKIGIHTILVLTHDHCFLGYFLDQDKKKVRFLETTMLSNSSYVDDKKKTISLSSAKTPAAKNAVYKRLFATAVATAMYEFNDYKSKNDVTIIDVDDMRELVRPMPIYN
ncbi:hypothetical protein [Mucilaginibacter sp.]|uniref:hypothetical protein n=1 Tax=Mucilaginibacter sp. TaxID=1882438 RepID=UPI0026388934|nr:hypothetical protein [Mucilaginibacter sp.]MDB4922033.1 hypothetical protein [Mucilaginibacter sp.]